MNTAVRYMGATTLRWIQFPNVWEGLKQSLMLIVLSSILFASAFSVVYVKDLHRRLYIQEQNLQAHEDTAKVEWGRLLLEQSTWSTQARVQQIATQQLKMMVPAAKGIKIITDVA